MDTLTTDILIDCLNMGKIVWKDGLTGTIVLGDKLQKTFTALPEHFTLTDYDVHLVSSTQILKDMQKIESLVYELIRGNIIEPDTAVDAIVSRSLSEMKDCIKKSWAKKKKENNTIEQLQQQLQQFQDQIKQLTEQNKQLQGQIDNQIQQKISLEKEKLKTDSDIRWYMAQTERKYKDAQIKNDSKKVEIELAQMYDGNPYNDQIRMK
jgi:predicted RNase H-like nuclease (RuvC/YqgF family)